MNGRPLAEAQAPVSALAGKRVSRGLQGAHLAVGTSRVQK